VISFQSNYLLLVLIVGFISVFTVLGEGCLYEIAGTFPSPKYVNGIQIGKGFAPCIILLLKISYNFTDIGTMIIARTCVIVTVASLVTTILYYTFMRKQACYDYYINISSLPPVFGKTEVMASDTVVPLETNDTDQNEELVEDLENDPIELKKYPPLTSEKVQDILEIFKELIANLWQPQLACFLVNLLTYLIYPMFISRFTSHDNAILNNRGWFLFILMGIFSLFDLIGKLLLREKFFVKIPTFIIYILVGVRFLLLPLWILCVKPMVLKADVFPVAITIFFALSSGFCGTYMMMHGPLTFDSAKKYRSVVSMGASEALGFALGTSLSFILKLL